MRHPILHAAFALVLMATLAGGEASPLAGQTFDIEIVEDGHAEKMLLIFRADQVALGFPAHGDTEMVAETSSVKRGTDGAAVQFSATFNDLGGAVISGTVSGDKLAGTALIAGGEKLAVNGKLVVTVKAVDANQAKDLIRARNPREAIPLLIQTIETRRNNLEESREALIRLVECFQRLKGDAVAEKQYAELSARYLTTPPALNGSTLPTAELATEDLLWKSWVPGQETRVVVQMRRVERNSRIKDGMRNATLQVGLEFSGAGPDLNLAGPGLNDIDAMRGLMNGPSPVFVARAGNLRFNGRLSVYAHVSGTVTGAVDFEGVPATVQKFDDITGTVALTQPKQMRETAVPLRKDATWQEGKCAATITEVRSTGEEMVVSFTLSGGERAPAGGMSASGSAMTAGKDSHSPYWLLAAADGRPIYPDQTKETTTDGTSTIELTFNNAGKAEKLVSRQVMALSQREVAVVLKNVALP